MSNLFCQYLLSSSATFIVATTITTGRSLIIIVLIATIAVLILVLIVLILVLSPQQALLFFVLSGSVTMTHHLPPVLTYHGTIQRYRQKHPRYHYHTYRQYYNLLLYALLMITCSLCWCSLHYDLMLMLKPLLLLFPVTLYLVCLERCPPPLENLPPERNTSVTPPWAVSSESEIKAEWKPARGRIGRVVGGVKLYTLKFCFMLSLSLKSLK